MRSQVDLQKQADQEGKGGWGVRAGCTKQQQVLEGKKQQQQQSQRAGDAWGSLEGVRTCEAVWDIPLGRTALVSAHPRPSAFICLLSIQCLPSSAKCPAKPSCVAFNSSGSRSKLRVHGRA